jgi:glycosyltransferase involved in cell wall biosynthesis
MPKVSVIIPTYNRAELLYAAIASVLGQTFQDFEILVVDDHSPDHTAQVVQRFHDGRIRYLLHETNKGGAAARNTGIQNSAGEYIAFLDDDDEWLPEKLGMQIALLENSPPEVGCIYTGYLVIDRASGNILGQKPAVKRGDLSTALLSGNCLGGTSSVLVRRECFNAVGLFDEALPSFQDYDLWIRLAQKFQFDCISRPLLKYYVHDQQIWTNLAALTKGLAIMLNKYAATSAAQKKYYSSYYLSLGVAYCYRGDVRHGRQAYLTAARLYPFEVRSYFNFCLSLLGASAFKFVKDAKNRIVFSRRRQLGQAESRGRGTPL